MLLRHRDAVAEVKMPAQRIHQRVKVTKGKGEIVTGETGWFKNIIVNNGRNGLADNSFTSRSVYCHVGTGSTAEAAGQTTLASFLAASNTIQAEVGTTQGAPPYYAKYVKTFRFAAGVATGTVREVGFSTQATDGDLLSRAVVRDPDGFQTAVEVRSDEWIDVAYEFRLYPDHVLPDGGLDDGSGIIELLGVSTNYVIRPAFVTTLAHFEAEETRALLRVVSVNQYARVYGPAAVLGAVTAEPSDPFGYVTTVNSDIDAVAYVADSFNRDVYLTIDHSEGNPSGGIGAIRIHTYMGSYQMSFSPVVAKTSLITLTIAMNFAWDDAGI
jgi:hypothetical protein